MFWRDLIVEEIGADPHKVRVVPNGVPDPGKPALRRKEGVPLILFLGDLQPWKGLGELIEALGSDAVRAFPWRLVCAGRGMQDAYQAQAAAAGIADRISFTGWVARDGVQRLLEEASIVALPSHLEGLSVTLVEALAHGIPVIATPVGAHPDILRDGENCVLVKVGDAASLAQGLQRLLQDQGLAQRIGQGGRVLFEQRLDIGLMEEQFDEIYRGLLRARARPHARVNA